MLNESQVGKIRSRFPILGRKIYFNSCSQGALSDAVEEGFRQYLDSWHDQGSPWETWIEQYERARTLFADFIGASADEIAVVTSASAGINAIASALSFKPRRKVVMGEFEFPTMGHVWLAQQPRGAEVQFVPADGDQIPFEHYERVVDRETLMVPLTHICFRNGFRSPVKEIVRLAHARGAFVMLDDYQDSGTRPVDVRALGVDFYVTGTLKYLLGPPGLAFLYVRKELVQSLIPTVTGWFGQTNPFAFDPKRFDLASSARRFQSGSPSIPNIYASVRGLELLRGIGMENVAGQVGQLTTKLLQGAAELGIQTKTPADSVGPLVVLKARDPEALLKKLGESGIVVSSRHDGLRVSLHVYNSRQDVETLLRALSNSLDLLVVDGVVPTRN